MHFIDASHKLRIKSSTAFHQFLFCNRSFMPNCKMATSKLNFPDVGVTEHRIYLQIYTREGFDLDMTSIYSLLKSPTCILQITLSSKLSICFFLCLDEDFLTDVAASAWVTFSETKLLLGKEFLFSGKSLTTIRDLQWRLDRSLYFLLGLFLSNYTITTLKFDTIQFN